MLISHLHRFIYMKTYETAGMSVEVYFERFCRDPALPFSASPEGAGRGVSGNLDGRATRRSPRLGNDDRTFSANRIKDVNGGCQAAAAVATFLSNLPI
jgi:hypothetical protein